MKTTTCINVTNILVIVVVVLSHATTIGVARISLRGALYFYLKSWWPVFQSSSSTYRRGYPRKLTTRIPPPLKSSLLALPGGGLHLQLSPLNYAHKIYAPLATPMATTATRPIRRFVKLRIHDATRCTTGCTTGCIVYTDIFLVVQRIASCIRGFKVTQKSLALSIYLPDCALLQ